MAKGRGAEAGLRVACSGNDAGGCLAGAEAQTSTVFGGGRRVPREGLGRAEQGLEGREEKRELCPRETDVFKLGKGKCRRPRAGRPPTDGLFGYSSKFWVLLKDSVHQTKCVFN